MSLSFAKFLARVKAIFHHILQASVLERSNTVNNDHSSNDRRPTNDHYMMRHLLR